MSADSIIIIGAGAAGLAAARDLSRAGREVIVVEARDRIGGRVFTHRDPESSVAIELGAEFVHGRSPELWQLARAANLELYEVSDRHWYLENDKVSKSREFWQKIEGLLDELKSSQRDQSLREFLDCLPDDEGTARAKSMLRRYVEGFHAANVDRISVQGLIKAKQAADSIDGDKAFRFVSGYDSLMQAMRAEAESHGAIFHLNTVVREIRWENDRVEVDCETSEYPRVGYARVPRASFAASAAIITLPLGVLQTAPEDGGVRFIPDLPDQRRAAISNLAMGNVVKINLRFRERFWEAVKLWDEKGEPVSFADVSFFHYPDAPFPTWWTQLPIRAPLLVGWIGGPRADHFGTDEVTTSTSRAAAEWNSPGREPGDRPSNLFSQARETGNRDRGSSPSVSAGVNGVSERPGSESRQLRAGIEAIDEIQAREAGDTDQSIDPSASEGSILASALSSLSLIFNLPAADIRDQLEAFYLHDWRDDPYSCGAYSYVPVNGLAAQHILSQPLDNKLFFAGEATSVGHIGTVHGAIHSGQRAAREILES